MSSRNGHGTIPKRQVLLHDVVAFIHNYVVASEDQLLVTALWTIHTHCIDAAEQTPYLAINSAEKKCGKSRLLNTLNVLCARPWETVLPTEAVVYRKVDAHHPTLLLDEIDTIFNPRTGDKYEGLRALLNNGNRRGAKIPRCAGPNMSRMVEFDTFCAKALAGIGTLPDTVADRSIPIRLERKTRDEPTVRFRRREVEPLAEELKARVEKWAEKHLERLKDARPVMPDELDDRAQDGCEILVAIAELMGCGEQARSALVKLLTGERLDTEETLRIQLLRDIRRVFGKQRAKISTETLLKKLHHLPGAGWNTYYGRGLGDRDLGKILRQYGIHSKPVRLGSRVAKGFKRDDFHSAWERYL